MREYEPSGLFLAGQGVIEVPPGTPTHDFAAMEAAYRPLLWPPVQRGMLRYSRDLRYNPEKTRLAYRIWDVPSRGR